MWQLQLDQRECWQKMKTTSKFWVKKKEHIPLQQGKLEQRIKNLNCKKDIYILWEENLENFLTGGA